MSEALRRAQLLFSRLSPREQRLVAVFGALLALVLAWNVVVSPVLSGRDGLRRDIEGLREEMASLDRLAAEIRSAETRAPKAKAKTESNADFSLLAFVEKAAGSALRPESIASMSPSRRPLEGGREESTVELKLSAVTLVEIVSLLKEIEGRPSPVYVKQFAIRKRYDDSSQFDVTLVTAAALPA